MSTSKVALFLESPDWVYIDMVKICHFLKVRQLALLGMRVNRLEVISVHSILSRGWGTQNIHKFDGRLNSDWNNSYFSDWSQRIWQKPVKSKWVHGPKRESLICWPSQALMKTSHLHLLWGVFQLSCIVFHYTDLSWTWRSVRVCWYNSLTENDFYILESIEPLKEDGSLDLEKLFNIVVC